MIIISENENGTWGVDLENLLDFLKAVGRLKHLPRTGWVEARIDEPESVADHSFRTALIAMLLSDLQGLNTDKAMRMALLHDLAEAEIGDLTPTQKEDRGPSFREDEDETLNKLLSRLPEGLAKKYTALWEEYRGSTSLEAKVVVHADKLEMVLQAMEYEEGGGCPTSLERFWRVDVGEGLPSDLLREIRKRRGRE